MESLKRRQCDLSRDIEHKVMMESVKACRVQERWIKSGENVIGYMKRAAAHKLWVAAYMIDGMDERRKFKDIHTGESE